MPLRTALRTAWVACAFCSLCVAAEAAREPDASDLPACLAKLRKGARDEMVSLPDFDRLTRGVRWQDKSIEHLNSQPETLLTWPQYWSWRLSDVAASEVTVNSMENGILLGGCQPPVTSTPRVAPASDSATTHRRRCRSLLCTHTGRSARVSGRTDISSQSHSFRVPSWPRYPVQDQCRT